MRKTLYSTTVFLVFDDEYLMLHRTGNVSVDKNRLNGIGGKLEIGENFLDSAIRETKEETGYEVKPDEVKFCGIVNLHGGYPDDWVMCFFKVKVSSKNIPHGSKIREGELIWMHKDNIIGSEFELVDDLNYLWEAIVNNSVFFADTIVSSNEKIEKISVSYLGT